MFRVDWIQDAVDDLTRLWTLADSASRQAITAASNTIDHELQNAPYRQSEGRASDLERILFVFPLAVYFEIDPDAQTCLGFGRVALAAAQSMRRQQTS